MKRKLSGPYLKYKQHLCKDCIEMAFGQSKFCWDCKVKNMSHLKKRRKSINEQPKIYLSE